MSGDRFITVDWPRLKRVIDRELRRRLLVGLAVGLLLGLVLGRASVSAAPRPAPAPVTGWGPVVVDPGLAEAPDTSPVPPSAPVVATTGVDSQPTNAPVANVSPGRTLSGLLSWFCGHGSPCTRGYGPTDLVAAAGPALRAWLGRTVTVCAAACVPAALVDSCECMGGARLLDGTTGLWGALGLDLRAGLAVVTVRLP